MISFSLVHEKMVKTYEKILFGRQSLNRTLSLQHLYNKNQITFKNILNINFLDIWFMVSLINL